MSQMGFFDIANRYAGLDAKNDPLAKIDAVVRWEDFRPPLEAVWRAPAGERKSAAGRKPWDAVLMFKAIVLCALYNLSDDQVEYQTRDRLSFMRFLGLGLEDRVPDAKHALGLDPWDGVALSGTTGAGGRDRDVVRGLRRLS